MERGPRLDRHLTADLSTGFIMWNVESRRLDLELDATNFTDNRYKVSKESRGDSDSVCALAHAGRQP